MHVALPHDDVDLAVDLDLGLVLGVEEHPVPDLDRARMGADRDHTRPGEPAGAHRRGGRDDDAAGGAPFTGLLVELDEEAVVQHLDGRGPRVTAPGRHAAGGRAQRATLRTMTKSTTTPTTAPAALRMLSVRGAPVSSSTKWDFTVVTCRPTMVLGWAR